MRLLASILLLALASAPSSDCGPSWSAPPPTPLPPPVKPYCYTDPPVGCGAYCKDVDVVAFTPWCNNIEAGEATDSFEMKVNAIVAQANQSSMALCGEDNLGTTLSPCMVGIVPTERANQDHETCMVGPACLVLTP